MAKEIVKKIKLQIPAGQATPAPPVGTVLGPAGINLQEFCSAFNEQTRDKTGDIIPCEISIYADRSFSFILKTAPASFLIKRAAKLKKAGSRGANELVATITKADVEKIAEEKMEDLNANDLEAAIKIIVGSARNMGIAVEGINVSELKEQAKEAAEAEQERLKREAELEALEEAAAEREEETDEEAADQSDTNVEDSEEAE